MNLTTTAPKLHEPKGNGMGGPVSNPKPQQPATIKTPAPKKGGKGKSKGGY